MSTLTKIRDYCCNRRYRGKHYDTIEICDGCEMQDSIICNTYSSGYPSEWSNEDIKQIEEFFKDE